MKEKSPAPKARTIILVTLAIVILSVSIGIIIYTNSESTELKNLAQDLVSEKCIWLTAGRVSDVKTKLTTVITEGDATYYLKGTYSLKDANSRTFTGNFQIELEKLGKHNWKLIDIDVLNPG